MPNRAVQQMKDKAAAKLRLAQNQAAAAPTPPPAEIKKTRYNQQQPPVVAVNLRDHRPAEQSPIVPTPAMHAPTP
jgi:hypothetical protein